MQYTEKQLAQVLKGELLSVYFITSSKSFLYQRIVDKFKAKAAAAGFAPQAKHCISQPSHWDTLASALHARSLFSEKECIHCHIEEGKIGKPGAAFLTALAEQLPQDKVVFFTHGKLTKPQKQAAWFKALDKVGCILTLWPPTADTYPRWLGVQARAFNLNITPQALQQLAHLTEGNLIAGNNALEVLSLTYPEQAITLTEVAAVCYQTSQATPFQLLDTLLTGNTEHALTQLAALEREGVAPAMLVWALAKECQALYAIAKAGTEGVPLASVFKQHGVWPKRQGPMTKMAKQHSTRDWLYYLEQLGACDSMAKGAVKGAVWQAIERLCCELTKAPLLAH